MIFKLNVWRYKLGFSIFKEGKTDIYGYTNRCGDGKFIIFLDYDDMLIEWILQELEYLQNDYHLGDFYIFESSENSYHAICFSKVNRFDLLNILRNSSIDENYVNVPYTMGKKLLTLRLTDKEGNKPKYLNCLESKESTHRLESKEHKLFFNKFFGNVISKEQIEKNNDNEHKTKLIYSNYKIESDS